MDNNIMKKAAYAATAFAVTAGGAMAAMGGLNDLEFIARGIGELIDPTPVKVHTGGFFTGKTRVIKANPFTGKISPYTGNKKPINKKPVRM